MEKSVEVLEQEITCAVCHGHYVDPKVLPCGHFYCKECIIAVVCATDANEPFPCPECRKETILPEGGVDKLQTAFYVNRIKEVHSQLELSMVSSRDGESAGSGPKPSFHMCKVHGEPKNIYCFDCSCLICRDCTITTHNSHTREFVMVAAPDIRTRVRQKLSPLNEAKEGLSCAMEKIEATVSELETQEVSVRNKITKLFEGLVEILENRKQQLLAETTAKFSQKVESLTAQKESLSTAHKSVQCVIGYAERCVENSANEELMDSYAEIQRQIDRELENQRKDQQSLEPVEEVDVGVEMSCGQELKQLCESKAKVLQLSLDPSKCTVTKDENAIVEVNKMAELQVMTKLSNGKPTKQDCIVECHLKSLVRDSITRGKVDRTGSLYRIQYTPTCHGPSQLAVTVAGENVAGSPFSVFVHSHPTKPIKVIPGLDSPRDVALNSSGEIVVTEIKGISLLDETGTLLKRIKSIEYNLKEIYCIAVDDADDCMYVTGNNSTDHKILRLNSDFKVRNEVSTKEKLQFRGLTLSDDKLMVCKRDSGIAVYTKELVYLRHFDSCGDGPRQFASIRDISSDKLGNLYISDYDASCILVLSNSGEFLRSFGCNSNGVRKLSGPRGVCVAKQYNIVYIANWHSHNISVFTTEGDYITSFGQKGGAEGGFKNPWGLSVDKDGFLYVCDQKHNRLHKYLCYS